MTTLGWSDLANGLSDLMTSYLTSDAKSSSVPRSAEGRVSALVWSFALWGMPVRIPFLIPAEERALET